MITIQALPEVSAGTDATIGEGNSYTVADASAAAYSSLFWTSQGDGVFDDATSLSPTYTPGSADLSAGSATLSVIAQSLTPCNLSLEDCMTIFIELLPVANAGPDATVCENETFMLTGASALNYSLLSWTSNGDGVFDDASMLHPTYTPGAADILAGYAELCLTAQPLARTVGVAQDCMILYFQAPPTAFAGDDITICDLQEVYLGEATAANYLQVMWFTTNGAGIFSNENIVNPTYYPSMVDLQQGCIMLGFIASPINPCITSSEDYLQLCFQVSPSAFAGDDATICETETYTLSGADADNYSSLAWTSSGDGAFDDASLLNPVYTPGSGDILEGLVELTISALPLEPCDAAAFASMKLTFAPQLTADAGDDLTITYNPESPEIQLDGTVTNSSLFNWSTAGDGNFNDKTIEDPIYTPGTQDVLNGTVLLSLYAESILPCVATITDDLNITFVTDPTAFAGNDAQICADKSYQLSEATATFYSLLSWTSNGDGVFDDASMLHPTYTPGAADILAGYAELCLTAQPLARTVGVAQDCMILYFQAPPTAFAGEDITICDLQEVYLGEATAGNYLHVMWFTTNGSGFFSNENIVNPSYYPTNTDLMQGCITLGFIASPVDPCSTSADDVIQLCFQVSPSAFAGDDATICETETYTLSGADADNYSSLAWTSSGDGAFDDASLLNPVYTPGSGDILEGLVELTISALPLEPCDAAAVSSMILTILPNQQIVIPAGWSGISSYIQPADANIETVMADVVDQLVIMYNYNNEIFYPAYNINTLNNWDSQKGYFIKVNDDATLNICGSKAENLTLNLTAGWNIIPVLSSQDVPVTDVFAPLGSILTIIKEVAGYHIYFPEYGIYTLSSLMSGKAYLVRVTEDCSITFPESFNKSQINNPQSLIDVPDIWSEVIPTPSSHQIIFPAAITRSFNQGDVIGAFSADGLCAGTIRVNDFDNANALTVFGDDAYTSSIDGMAGGLEMTFKLFRPGTSEVFDINTEFIAGMNDGHFANNGISVVKAFSLVSVNELVSGFKPNIYPNPAKNSVTIEFEGLINGTFDVEMMNAFGEVIKRGKSTETSANLDVSGLSRGVYFLRLTSGGQTFIEKLILQ